MTPFAGTTRDAAIDYVRQLAGMLDSAMVTLVGVFRNTSGQPLAGASSPDAISMRERDRWGRCRNLHFDLTTYRPALESAAQPLESDPVLDRAMSTLDSALAALEELTVECDNVASMLAAPGRWSPWQEQYETTARRFYGGWYPLIRAAHERDRALVQALNAAAPARQAAPPPALPRNPPYAGAAVR